MITFLAPASMCFDAAGPVGEETGRLEHDVDAQILPGQLGRVAQRQHFELVAVHGDAVGFGLDLRVQVAQHRVVLQQVGERVRAGQIVDCDEIDVLIAERGAHDVAADASEPVNANPDRHR